MTTEPEAPRGAWITLEVFVTPPDGVELLDGTAATCEFVGVDGTLRFPDGTLWHPVLTYHNPNTDETIGDERTMIDRWPGFALEYK